MPTSDDNDYRQRLINFFSVLHQKLQNYREMKRHLDRFLSTDFNVFDVFIDRIKHKENCLSAIIADLLSPSGSHGQQRIFLDAFLRRIERGDLLVKQPRKVDTEFRCQGGFIDILVDFGDFGIGIENKPWAGDQDEQLRRYHDYLKKGTTTSFALSTSHRTKEYPQQRA